MPQQDAANSPFREFAAEAVVLAGGGTAILLQLAHPDVAAGVANHSDFVNAPMRRLWGTLDFVTAEAFGGPDEQAFVRHRVNAQHARVNGVDQRGNRYDANDSAAQYWVAATLCWSAVRAHRKVYGRRATSGARADAIVREFGRMGTALRMRAHDWPRSAAEFDRRFAQQLRQLEVGEAAQQAKTELFVARHADWWLRMLMPVASRLAVSLLPPQIATAYGHPHTRASKFVANLCWAPVIAAGPLLPRPIRTLPARLVLRRVRRLAAATRAG